MTGLLLGEVLSLNVGGREVNPAKDVGVTGIGKRPVASATLRAPRACLSTRGGCLRRSGARWRRAGAKADRASLERPATLPARDLGGAGAARSRETRPTKAQVRGLGSGLVGDFIGDVASHGGDGQAVYAFAREELDRWGERLGRTLANGLFGENVTTTSFDVDAARVGDRWSIGDPAADGVLLEVTGPRIPCATFAHRMGEPGWLRRFTEVGRSGAYLAIVTAGTVRPGDPIGQVSQVPDGIELPVVYRAYLGDLEAARVVLAAGCLAEEELQWLRDRVARRNR